MNKLTEQQCKSILFKLGIKYGISPRKLSEQLLSQDDKNDMLEGRTSLETLNLHVKLWIEQGCPDLVNIKGKN